MALRWSILAEISKGPGQQTPKVLFATSKELQRAGLAKGDPVLVTKAGSSGSSSTVAFCELGGRDGGLLVSSTVLESVGAAIGEELSLTKEFVAKNAGYVELEVPAELRVAWADLAGGLSFEKYLAAVFEDSVLVAGDVRKVLVNGKAWIVRCQLCSNKQQQSSSKSGSTPTGPWLVTRKTKLQLRTASTQSTAAATNLDKNKAETGGGEDSPLPTVGFARVGGLSKVLDELYEAVKLPLERPDLYRSLGVGPPRGVLLYGPPGTGKTLLAKSLAEELQCPVELCSATDLVGSGIGESESRITALFDACRRRAEENGTGVLLFIDEVDALCPKRDDSNEAERRMVAAFLTSLDGVKGGGDGVVVLAATNRPNAIDPALRRAGRLEREIEVGVPNTEERLQILQVHLQQIKHSLTLADMVQLSRRCHGYVGADLRGLCLQAARAALRRGATAVSLEHCLDAVKVVPPSALKELLVEVPAVRWSDIGGYERTKEALREAVEWPIKHGWAFESMQIDAPRGVLLYGPPGCSKTMLAKAVATETEMNFVSIKGPELFSKYVGDSERAVREVFRKARLASPCVIFFDEIDAIGASREGDGGSGVAARVLAQLLAEMDGISVGGSQRHVVVLAATNRPQVLDSALTRPGRFDRLVHVPLPDDLARSEILKHQLGKMRVAEDVDLHNLASRTSGFSGAEVVMVCREAAVLAIREALDAATHARGGAHSSAQADDAAHGEAEMLPRAESRHFEAALSSQRPRIDAQTVAFYEDFERKTRHM